MMEQELKGRSLAEKLAAITKEIGSIPKIKHEDSTVKYAFRGIDDVMNALNPLLSKYGIVNRIKILSHSGSVREFTDQYNKKKEIRSALVEMALVFGDGETEWSTEEIAYSEDYSDKAYTQAVSMAYKYAILRVFCIPTKDLEDPDGKTADPPTPGAGELKSPAKNTAKTVPAKTDKPKAKKPIAEMDGTEMTKEWANVIGKLSTGMVTFERVREIYELTVEQEVKLLGYVKTP